MCQDKAHGGARCSSDDSASRRRRRKAQQVRSVHTARTAKQGELVVPSKALQTMDDIKAEAAILSQLLKAPVDPDVKKQDKIDAELEKRVTQLGLALGEEADRRSGVSPEKIQEELEVVYKLVENDFAAERKERAKLGAISDELRKELDEKVKILREANPEQFADVSKHYTLVDEEVVESVYSVKFQIPESVDRESVEFKEWKVAHTKAKQAWDAYLAIDSDTEEIARRRKIIEDEAIRKVVAANRSVLSEIRPLGGEIKATSFSNKEAVEIMQQTVGKDYPTEWLKQSAEFSPLAISSQQIRPFYSSNATFASSSSLDKAPRMHTATFRSMDDIAKLKEQDDIYFSSGEMLSETPDGEMVQAVLVTQRAFLSPEGWTRDSVGENGNPVSDKWKYGYIVSKEEGSPYSTLSEEKQWYRIIEDKNLVMCPNITMDTTDQKEIGRIPYHEFAHRMEHVSEERVIPRMEEAFLRRRTTDENSKRSEMINVSPGTNADSVFNTELGRDAGFVNIYVGREYAFNDSREVLSMGMESIFAAKNGALMGLQWSKKDLDHRAFTLGITATA